MGNILLPGYEHQIVTGAGLNTSPGKPKVVLHTTETGPGSTQFLINSWFQNWGSGLPHFIVEGSRVVQLLPLNVGAYTLENAPGGADTNRSGPAIQAEIVSYSANDWDDATYESVGKLLADVKKAGHDFDLGVHPKWWGANEGVVLASYSSPIRMTAQQYIDFNGWCAHQHCPENAHWDCGKKDTTRIESIARRYYGGPVTPIPEEDIMASLDDLKKAIHDELAPTKQEILDAVKAGYKDDGLWMGTDAGEGKIYIVINGVKYHVPGINKPDGSFDEAATNARLELLKGYGFDDRKVQDAILRQLPEAAFTLA